MIQTTTYKEKSRMLHFSILIFTMAVCLLGCVETSASKSYNIYCARSFEIVEASQHAGEAVRYRINRSEGRIITSVGYSESVGLFAVATTQKNPKNSAEIELLDSLSLKPIKSIILHDYFYIKNVAIDINGGIYLAVRFLDRSLPEEIVFIGKNQSKPSTIARAYRIIDLSIDRKGDNVYFAFKRNETDFFVAYVKKNLPMKASEIGKGSSVTVSEKGNVAYLRSDGKIVLISKGSDRKEVLNLPSNMTDPAYTDSIRFVDNSEDIIVQHYKKSVVYDLLITSPPYSNIDTLLSRVGMVDFFVTKEVEPSRTDHDKHQ